MMLQVLNMYIQDVTRTVDRRLTYSNELATCFSGCTDGLEVQKDW